MGLRVIEWVHLYLLEHAGKDFPVGDIVHLSNLVIIQVSLTKWNYLFPLFHVILGIFGGIILPTHFHDEPKFQNKVTYRKKKYYAGHLF